MADKETDLSKPDEVDSALQQKDDNMEVDKDRNVMNTENSKDESPPEGSVEKSDPSKHDKEVLSKSIDKTTGDGKPSIDVKESVTQTALASNDDTESADENDTSQIDEDGMDSTLDTTADETEDSLVIDEDDIVKPSDVFGRGKRPKKKKASEDYIVDYEDGKTGKKVKRPRFGKGRQPGGKMINNVSATESKENTKDLQDLSLSSSVKRKSLPQEQLDLLQVPFEHGWRREVVIRNIVDHSSKSSSKADVYYHPPHGRKLRSMVEIVKYLVMTNSELTQENFSFLRNAILKPPFEVVRYAGSVKGGFNKSFNSPAKSKTEVKPEVYIDRDEDYSDFDSKAEIEKTPSVDNATSDTKVEKTPDVSRPKRGRPPNVILGQKRKRDSSSPRTVEVIKQESDDLIMEVFTEKETHEERSEPVKEILPRVANQTSAKKHKPTARKSTTQKPSKISQQSNGSPQVSQTTPKSLCNLTCPGRNMAPPTLQCAACQCLFHPECVGFNSSLFPFVCNGCVILSCQLSSTPKTQAKPPSKAKPALLPITTVMKQESAATTVTTQCINSENSLMNLMQLKSMATAPVQSTSPVLSLASSGKKSFPHISQETISHLKSAIERTKLPTSSNTTTNATLVQTLNAPPLNAKSIIAQPMPSLVASPTAYVVPNNVPNFHILATSTGKTNTVTNQAISSSAKSKPPTPKAAEMMPPKLTAAPHVSPAKTATQPSAAMTMPPATSSVPPPLQSPPTNGIDMNTAAKNGQLLTLPAAVVKRLNLDQPLALKINNMQITVPSSCFLQTNEGLKVFLPPKTFPVQIGETAKLSVTVTNDKSMSNNTSISVKIGDDSAKTKTTTQKKETAKPIETSVEKKERKFRHGKSGINPGQCFIKKLYGGADCMLEIFKYLNMSDLARVGRVCRAWRTLSMHPCLWKEVKFRGMEVRDWKKAVDFLLRRAVQCLNFKGLKHPCDRTKTWQKVVTLLPRLTSATDLHFGQVPSSVLHSLCERMPHLEVFTAKWITDFDDDKMWTECSRLDIGKFCCLSDLRELRLRGVAGLKLPSISLGGGLDDLSTLENLSVLSLTSLVDVPEEEFAFLSKLTHSKLEVLELGNCNRWTKKTYSLLEELVHLKILRLEDGDNTEDCGLTEALLKLTKLETLELIMFLVDHNLERPLSMLSEFGSLRTLALWPDTCSANPAELNSTTFSIVSKLTKLKYLKWGIVSDKNSNMNSEKESEQNKQWVPFLPRENFQEPAEYKQVCTVTAELSKLLPNTYITIYKSDTITPEETMESSEDS